MENFINSLPKPVLALLAIVVGIIVFVMISPPHTVCDTQADALKENQKGNIFASKDAKKNIIPPSIQRSKEACQLGNSAGSCYEYFQSLRRVADDINKSSQECAAQLYNVAEVRTALTDGTELMVRLAWGLKPPEPTLERFGWMQESEISTFCRLRSVYIRANGEESWIELRRKIATKLPGEEIPPSSDPNQIAVQPRMVNTMMTEENIWDRSLFSASCNVF